MTVCQPSPEEFEDRIIVMSMFNDIDWTKKGNHNEYFSSCEKVKDLAKRFPLGHWFFLAPGGEKLYGTHEYKLEERWKTTADAMVANFKDSGHPVFPASSGLDLEKERWTMYESLEC